MSIDKDTVKHIANLARISLDEKIRDQVLKNSPEKNEEFFVVPKVIE